MTQATVSITTVIHTKPATWEELLERVGTGKTTYEDESVLLHLRNELDCIAATYPTSEYFRYLARLMGMHQQMSPATSLVGAVESIGQAADDDDEPEFPSQEEWELDKLYVGSVKPIILGGEK